MNTSVVSIMYLFDSNRALSNVNEVTQWLSVNF